MFHLEKVQWYLKYKQKFSINRKVGWKFEHILLFQCVIRMRNAKLYEYLVKYDNYLSNISFVVVDVFCLFCFVFCFVFLFCFACLSFCFLLFCFLFFVFVFFTVFVFFFVGFLLFLLRNYIQHEYSDYLPTTLTKLECCSWISHAMRTIALTNRTTPIIALHTHAVIRMTPL